MFVNSGNSFAQTTDGGPLVGGTFMPITYVPPDSGDGSAELLTPGSGSAARDYQDYWDQSNIAADWWNHQDVYSHNEALAAFEREQAAAADAWKRESSYNAMEAAKNRDFERYMSDTAMRRKVADYVAAGFSPLAALEGAVGASSPSGSAASATGHKASANAATQGGNNFGGVIGSIIAAIALIAAKGFSAVAKASQNSGKAAAIAADEARKGVLYDSMKDEVERFASSKSYRQFHGDINAWRKAGRP